LRCRKVYLKFDKRNNNEKFGSREKHINGLEGESRVIDFVLYITMWVERVRIKICRKTKLERKKCGTSKSWKRQVVIKL
jgi:hypothetical protein